MLFSAIASYHTLISSNQSESPYQLFAAPIQYSTFNTAQIMPPTTKPARPKTAKPAVSNFTAAPVVAEPEGAVLVALVVELDVVLDAVVLAEVLLELLAAERVPPWLSPFGEVASAFLAASR